MCLYPAWPLPQGLYSSFHFPSCQSLPPLFSRTLPLSKCWPLLNACFRSCASSKFTWSRVLARVLHYVCRENAFKSINYFLSKFIFQPLWSSNIKSSPTCIPPPPAGIHWLVLTDSMGYRISLPPLQDHHVPCWVLLPLNLSCRTQSGGDMGYNLKRAYVLLGRKRTLHCLPRGRGEKVRQSIFEVFN